MEFKKVLGVPTGLKRVVLELNYGAAMNLTLKGKLSEEITFATMPIPIGAGFTVDASFILYVNASGEISLCADLSKNVKSEYSDGKIKKSQTGSESTSFEFAVKIEGGAGFKATLTALGIKVIDAKVTAGVEISAKAGVKASTEVKKETTQTTETMTTTQKIYLYWSTQISAPVVKLSVGTAGTLANKLKITGSWTLLSAEKAPLQIKPEILNGEKMLFELKYSDTTELENPADGQEDENSENGNGNGDSNNPYATLVIDQVMLTMDPGDVELLTFASFPPGENERDLSYATGDPNVAMVNQYGYITAVCGGSTQIYVETTSGAVQACVVTVTGDSHDFTPDDFL